jgi:hypothetical protein
MYHFKTLTGHLGEAGQELLEICYSDSEEGEEEKVRSCCCASVTGCFALLFFALLCFSYRLFVERL